MRKTQAPILESKDYYWLLDDNYKDSHSKANEEINKLNQEIH